MEKFNNLPEEGLREINHLNTQLVQQLKSSDTAFSLGIPYCVFTLKTCFIKAGGF